MKKILLFALSLALLSVILLGCQSEGYNIAGAEKMNLNQETSGNEKLKPDGKIATVSVSKSKGINATVFNDEASIATLESIISSAVKVDGLVNMTKPESLMSIIYENDDKQSFHLWIGKGKQGEKGALMKTDETHTIYSISEEMTKALIDLLN